jgi:hypothetical protein
MTFYLSKHEELKEKKDISIALHYQTTTSNLGSPDKYWVEFKSFLTFPSDYL